MAALNVVIVADDIPGPTPASWESVYAITDDAEASIAVIVSARASSATVTTVLERTPTSEEVRLAAAAVASDRLAWMAMPRPSRRAVRLDINASFAVLSLASKGSTCAVSSPTMATKEGVFSLLVPLASKLVMAMVFPYDEQWKGEDSMR